LFSWYVLYRKLVHVELMQKATVACGSCWLMESFSFWHFCSDFHPLAIGFACSRTAAIILTKRWAEVCHLHVFTLKSTVLVESCSQVVLHFYTQFYAVHVSHHGDCLLLPRQLSTIEKKRLSLCCTVGPCLC
jgi:hypothetical protein